MRLLTVSVMGVVVGSAIGAKPASVNLRGVTAGVTTGTELDSNERWGQCLSKAPQADGSLWLEYQFWAWRKVVAVVRDGVVQTIDAVPPDGLAVQKLADLYKLGELATLSSLTPGAQVGPPVPEHWQVLAVSDAAGVLLFVEMVDGRQCVRLMRLYAPGPLDVPLLGVHAASLSTRLARQWSLNAGTQVREMFTNSPAVKAGLQRGDVIVEFDGRAITNTDDLQETVRQQLLGSRHPVKVIRNGKERLLEVFLDSGPADFDALRRGILHQRMGEHDIALAAYTQAIAHNPRSTTAFSQRAQVYWLQKQADKALAELDTALEIEDDSAVLYYRRGYVRYRQQHWDRALADLDEALRLDPDYWNAHVYRGWVHHDKKEHQEALECFDRALELHPKHRQAWYALYGRGLIHQRNGDLDLALADLNEAQTRNPKSVEVLAKRASVYNNKKEHDLAIADCDEAIRLAPGCFAAHLERGVAYHFKGEYETAIACYRQAIKTNRQHPEEFLAHSNLGFAYKALKDDAQAAICFEKALELNPKWTSASKALAHLRQQHSKETSTSAAKRAKAHARPAGVPPPAPIVP